jgi:hypothetical protein
MSHLPFPRPLAQFLGAAAPASDDGQPIGCTYSDFTKDSPVDAKGKPQGMAYGMREMLISGGVVLAGATIGAVSSSEHRVRNGAIGAAAGLLAAGANIFREFSDWKNAGGSRHLQGACAEGWIDENPEPSTAPNTQVKGKP